MCLPGFVKAAYQLHCSVAFAKQCNRVLRTLLTVKPTAHLLISEISLTSHQTNAESFLHNTWAYCRQIRWTLHTYTHSHQTLILTSLPCLGSSSSTLAHLCGFSVSPHTSYQLPAVRRYWFTALTCSDLSCGCAIIVCLDVYSHAFTISFSYPTPYDRPLSCCYQPH